MAVEKEFECICFWKSFLELKNRNKLKKLFIVYKYSNNLRYKYTYFYVDVYKNADRYLLKNGCIGRNLLMFPVDKKYMNIILIKYLHKHALNML